MAVPDQPRSAKSLEAAATMDVLVAAACCRRRVDR
jgi:hypothetical protein